MTSSNLPAGFHTLTPHLNVNDALAAIEFYKKAFGAEVEVCLKHPKDGSVMHACLKIGDSKLMLNEECKEWGSLSPLTLKGTPVNIHLYVGADVDGAFDRAVAAGATAIMPLADMFWGDRYGVVKDPFGHQWSLAMKIQDLTQDQILANLEAQEASMAK